jgi:putative membrane protein
MRLKAGILALGLSGGVAFGAAFGASATARADADRDDSAPASARTEGGRTLGSEAGAGAVSVETVLAKLHDANQMEIKAGMLAKEKGGGRGAREFGDMLVTDHKAADKKVLALAKKRGLSEPQLTDAAKAAAKPEEADEHEKVMMQLHQTSGPEFDKIFAQAMADGHGKVVAMVRDARAGTDDAQLKGLLGELLPKLEKHQRTAQALLGSEDSGAPAQGRRPPRH